MIRTGFVPFFYCNSPAKKFYSLVTKIFCVVKEFYCPATKIFCPVKDFWPGLQKSLNRIIIYHELNKILL